MEPGAPCHARGAALSAAAASFTGLRNPSLSEDGLSFRVDITTAQGTVPLEAPVADIGKFMHLLGKVSNAAADLRQLPRSFASEGTLSLRPVPASAMGVMAGEPGKALVVMLVGATTLAWQLDAHLLRGFAAELESIASQLDR